MFTLFANQTEKKNDLQDELLQFFLLIFFNFNKICNNNYKIK